MEDMVCLRPATVADLVLEKKLIVNRVFFYKSKVTGNFCGPYEVQYPDEETFQMRQQIGLGMIWVPAVQSTPESVIVTLKFIEAIGKDMKVLEWLKINYCYWLLVDGSLVGPYFLSYDKTNTLDLAAQLKEGRVYILAHKSLQTFPELNQINKAS